MAREPAEGKGCITRAQSHTLKFSLTPDGPVSGLAWGTRADEMNRFQTETLFHVLGSSDVLKAVESLRNLGGGK